MVEVEEEIEKEAEEAEEEAVEASVVEAEVEEDLEEVKAVPQKVVLKAEKLMLNEISNTFHHDKVRFNF